MSEPHGGNRTRPDGRDVIGTSIQITPEEERQLEVQQRVLDLIAALEAVLIVLRIIAGHIPASDRPQTCSRSTSGSGGLNFIDNVLMASNKMIRESGSYAECLF